MKRQGLNPYLPSWEYIPDGEPYVFNNRVYIYGSHDKFNGHAYCLNDYVCWSAPVYDLGNWSYEGVIYEAIDVENNEDRNSCLYAPDVAQGLDGRYYLYYVDSKRSIVSVAVCNEPAGRFKFYGYVSYKDGTPLGAKSGDEPQFDPGVLVEDDKVYLYTGFSSIGDRSRHGAMATVLESDMLTVKENPVFVIPSQPYSEGSGFEGHEFFEAPSIRKVGHTYYMIYSSILMHELCYAVSQEPTKGFVFQGTLISNADVGISHYKPFHKPMYYGGNNHGSIINIDSNWYVFYHRHTNGTNYSRQACAERIEIWKNGKINQVEMTSCGLNNGPLSGKGEYPAYLACNLFCNCESVYTDFTGSWMNNDFPRITQDGRDGDEEVGYIQNMKNGATAGFKYFDLMGVKKIRIWTRGYCQGIFEVRTVWDGPVLAEIPIHFDNVWNAYESEISMPEGKQGIYLTYKGGGSASLKSFELLGVEGIRDEYIGGNLLFDESEC